MMEHLEIKAEHNNFEPGFAKGYRQVIACVSKNRKVNKKWKKQHSRRDMSSETQISNY